MAQYTQIKYVTHCINRVENKNFMVVSKEEEKAFSKTQHPIMKKKKEKKIKCRDQSYGFLVPSPHLSGGQRTIRECFTNKPRLLILIMVCFAVLAERLNIGV